MTMNAVGALATMPATRDSFETGALSWSQVRAIVAAVRSVDRQGRRHIDRMIAFNAPRLTQMDPDDLLARVDAAVAQLRDDLAVAREERQIAREYLSIQGRLDGSSTIMGEASPESTATIVDALDALAPPPVSTKATVRPRAGSSGCKH